MRTTWLLVVCLAGTASAAGRIWWKPVAAKSIVEPLFVKRPKPKTFKVFDVDEAAFRAELQGEPTRFLMNFPSAEGQPELYELQEHPNMAAELTKKYDIHSYIGQGVRDGTRRRLGALHLRPDRPRRHPCPAWAGGIGTDRSLAAAPAAMRKIGGSSGWIRPSKGIARRVARMAGTRRRVAIVGNRTVRRGRRR